jgi:hypothetical protein
MLNGLGGNNLICGGKADDTLGVRLLVSRGG